MLVESVSSGRPVGGEWVRGSRLFAAMFFEQGVETYFRIVHAYEILHNVNEVTVFCCRQETNGWHTFDFNTIPVVPTNILWLHGLWIAGMVGDLAYIPRNNDIGKVYRWSLILLWNLSRAHHDLLECVLSFCEEKRGGITLLPRKYRIVERLMVLVISF